MSEFPDIACTALYPTLPVKDLVRTIDFYTEKLQFDLRFAYGDPPTHAAVSLGEPTIHFFSGEPVPTGHWVYFDIRDNIDALYKCYASRGIDMIDQPADKPWGMREFNLRDLNGYIIRFGQFAHQAELNE